MKARNETVKPILGSNVQSYEAYVKAGSEAGRLSKEVHVDWDSLSLLAYRVSLKKAMSDPDEKRRESA